MTDNYLTTEQMTAGIWTGGKMTVAEVLAICTHQSTIAAQSSNNIIKSHRSIG
ncbi:MAG: hypothetical protein RR588_01020 [Solibacillus sp.]